ncbi:MAG: arylsulfatase A-like enzyme, partial [Cryomorphaceae bacterium]
DLGYGDVGVFYQNSREAGQPSFKTPHIDQLAKEGIQLRAHYAPAPVCAPSRASLFLGQSQGNAPVRNNQFDKALPDQPTLASTLKQAGYSTGLIGKWGLQGKVDQSKQNPEGWPSYPTKRGFDYFLGYVTHVDGHEHYPFENIHMKKRKKKVKLWEQGEEISTQLKGCYTTDLFTAASKRFLVLHQKNSPQKPFFLTLSYDTPHAATQIATMAYPDGFGVNGGVQWVGKKGKMINTANDSVNSYIHPDYQKKDWKDVSKRYASSIRRMDSSVADVVQTLKDLKLDENTLIVFTSDHGPSKESYIKQGLDPSFFQSFGPFTGIKRDCWEGGIRPGAIAKWPAKIKPGTITESPSQMQDWMPTFCEIAKTSTPAIADGVSLIPTLTGDENAGSEIYVEYIHPKNTPKYEQYPKARAGQKRGEMQAIRQGKYKAVRYNIKSAEDPFLVFDLTKDPAEANNLAAKPGVPGQQHWQAAVSRLHHTNPSAKRPYDGVEISPLKGMKTQAGVKVTEAKVAAGAATKYISRYSYQLSGYIIVDESGSHTFSVAKGVKAILRVHKINVLDTDSNEAYPNDNTLNLKAGMHPFTLYLKEKPATLEVIQWVAKGGSEFKAIPAKNYCH